MTAAVLVIAGFTYYISVAKDEPFRRRFAEMSALSLAAAFSFAMGFGVRALMGIEV